MSSESEADRNPHGYDIAEWSGTYDRPHHDYPGGGPGVEDIPPRDRRLDAPSPSLPPRPQLMFDTGSAADTPPLLPPPRERSLVYFSGPPGVGKSTLMRHLTRYCVRHELTPNALGPARDLLYMPRPAAYYTSSSGAIELGRRRDNFSGTDALPMDAVVAAEKYMRGNGLAYSLILAEGDRLANRRFLVGARDAGFDVTLFHLHAPAPLLDARCRERGSTQSAGWRAGRETKAINLSAAIAAEQIRVVAVDARQPVEAVAAYCVQWAPVLRALLRPDAPESALECGPAGHTTPHRNCILRGTEQDPTS